MSSALRVTARGYASRVLARLLSGAVCALGAHALLYGTLRPGDGLHGYFGWYEPAIALAAVAAVLLVRPFRLRSPSPVGETARRLSTTALVVLLVQESLERSLAGGRPAFAAFTPAQLLVLVAGIAATALLLALALRAGQAVVRLVRRAPSVRRAIPGGWSVVAIRLVPARPLAARFALRAPPASA
jgi:hypothetical protein